MVAVSGVLPTPFVISWILKKGPSHLSHRSATDFSAILFRQGFTKVNEGARPSESNDLAAGTPTPLLLRILVTPLTHFGNNLVTIW